MTLLISEFGTETNLLSKCQRQEFQMKLLENLIQNLEEWSAMGPTILKITLQSNLKSTTRTNKTSVLQDSNLIRKLGLMKNRNLIFLKHHKLDCQISCKRFLLETKHIFLQKELDQSSRLVINNTDRFLLWLNKKLKKHLKINMILLHEEKICFKMISAMIITR